MHYSTVYKKRTFYLRNRNVKNNKITLFYTNMQNIFLNIHRARLILILNNS